jgi:mRNA interferase MazF
VLVVALPERLGAPRYPLLVIAPLTTQISEWAGTSPLLYPVLRAGIGGLVKDSAIMLDHVRGMDVRRVIKPLGTLSAAEYGPIQAGFERMFEFEGRR